MTLPIRKDDIDAIHEAWRHRDQAAIDAAAARVGLVLPLGALDRLVAHAVPEDHRRPRAVVMSLVDAAASDLGIALHVWRGGLCLAVRHADHVVAATGGFESPSMVWPSLRPWYQQLSRNAERVSAWAREPEPDRVRFALVPAEPIAAGTLATEAELIRQIVERPDDAAARLVLADLLMEREDVRGELIRLHHELETLPLDELERRVRIARSRELATDHGPRLAGEIFEHAAGYELVGGFVDTVTMSASAFRQHGARLFAAQPIRKLHLRPSSEDAIATLAKAPALRTLRALDLGGQRGHISDLALAPLGGAGLERLEELELQHCRLDAHNEDAMARLDAPGLRALVMHAMYLSGPALRGLAANRTIGEALETVRCTLIGDVPDPELSVIADQSFGQLRLPRLRRLLLSSCWFATEARLASLVTHAPELASFEVDGDVGRETLAALGGCRSLERLVLKRGIDLDLLDGVLALPRLSVLQLGRYPLSDAECAQLAERLLALPGSHPLRRVRFERLEAPARSQLQRRFPW